VPLQDKNGRISGPSCGDVNCSKVQGSFREHIVMLNKLEGVTGVEVRTREQLHSVDGLIIPGGALHFSAPGSPQELLCDLHQRCSCCAHKNCMHPCMVLYELKSAKAKYIRTCRGQNNGFGAASE
jgi:hypothetical protein